MRAPQASSDRTCALCSAFMAQVSRISLQMQNSREAIIMAAACCCFQPALGKILSEYMTNRSLNMNQ